MASVDKFTIKRTSEHKKLGIHVCKHSSFREWAIGMALSLSELAQGLFYVLTLGLLDLRVYYYRGDRREMGGLRLQEYLVFDLFDDDCQ